ncbi:MAG: hypothetical protein LC107_04125 [Chitinophagales bacterium]|nr:hypothetical protein [Chitinophagales bacterium]
MLKNVQEIVPNVGLGGIKFGMTRDEVKVIIGPPDDKESLPGFEEEVNDQLESWHYDEYEFSLVFDGFYDWRLVSIAVSDPYFTLFGEHVIEMDKASVLDLFENNNVTISHVEDVSDDENPDLILMESEESGMMIWFQDDIAIEIQFLPDVEDDEETIIWPE